MVFSTDNSSAPARVLSYEIPESDLSEFALLPAEVQKDVLARLEAMQTIAAAKSVRDGAMRVSRSMNGTRGWSPARLRMQWADFSAQGNWRSLLNCAKAGPAHYRSAARVENLPAASNPAFIQFVKAEMERCQRNSRQAHRNIIDRWRRWYAGDEKARIPGYAVCPPPAAHGLHPVGWSEKNIWSMSPDRAELTRARQGQRAASHFRPSVLTTRYGLKLCEFIQFDDVEWDLKVNFPGQRQAMRPRGFFAVDVLSACDVGMFWKPTLWDQAEDKKKTLTERDFLWFVLHTLMDTGYRADQQGTTLIWEHGTATVRDRALLSTLERLTGGRVRPAVSGILGVEQMAGMFEGTGRGNFRFKSLRESLFGLLHNYFQQLPGQVGLNRDRSPEQMAGLERYNAEILALVPKLSPERAANLQVPLLTWAEFNEAALRLLDRIANRTDHEMEGWGRCGFLKTFWRLAEGHQWISQDEFDTYSEAQRLAVTTLISSDPARFQQQRRMSPREVLNAGRNELTRLRHEQLPVLLSHRAEEMGREVTVRRGLITIESDEFGLDPVCFQALDARRGRGHRLQEGEKFLAFVNPIEPSHLVACDSKMRIAAICQLWDRPSRNDLDAVGTMMGRQRAHENLMHREQDARHLYGFAAEHARMLKHNEDVKEGKPVTPEERAHARDLDERVATEGEATAADFLSAPETPVEVSTDDGDISGEEFLNDITSPRE